MSDELDDDVFLTLAGKGGMDKLEEEEHDNDGADGGDGRAEQEDQHLEQQQQVATDSQTIHELGPPLPPSYPQYPLNLSIIVETNQSLIPVGGTKGPSAPYPKSKCKYKNLFKEFVFLVCKY